MGVAWTFEALYFPYAYQVLSATRKHWSECSSFAPTTTAARTGLTRWGCFPACWCAPTAALSCISNGTRTKPASRTVIYAAARLSLNLKELSNIAKYKLNAEAEGFYISEVAQDAYLLNKISPVDK